MMRYELIKFIGFVVAFFVGTFVQVLAPYRRDIKSDLKNWLVNLPMAGLNTFALSLVCSTCVVKWVQYSSEQGLAILSLERWPYILQILLSIFVLDFVSYWWHRANHRVPLLWRFHAVHHSDTNFDTSTAVRFHIGELIVSLGIRSLVIIFLGLPLDGILVFELVYQFFNIFEHGNIRLPEGFEKKMGMLFVTPALHRKHHSIEISELNSNYGTIFSFWDRLGRSYTPGLSKDKVTVGLPGGSVKRNLWQVLLLPFGGGPRD